MRDGTTTAPAGGALLNAELLRQGAAIARGLEAGQFTATVALVPGGTVGKHLRHVAEFYEAFLDGLVAGLVIYERRRRDGEFENSPGEAARRMEALARRMAALDPAAGARTLRVRGEGSEGDARSTVAREIDVLLSHTIHHYALIAVLLRGLGVAPPEDLGVAPSTLRHWEATAPR